MIRPCRTRCASLTDPCSTVPAGLARTDARIQFPGIRKRARPHDLRLLFEHFMYLMVKRMQANSRGRNHIKQKSAES